MRLVFVLELGALYLAYCLTVIRPLDMPQVSIFNIKTEKVKVEKKIVTMPFKKNKPVNSLHMENQECLRCPSILLCKFPLHRHLL